MNLKLELTQNYKLVKVNGKEIKIPKLGLRHRAVINPDMDHEETVKAIFSTINKNLSVAERDFLTVHLMAHNGKIKDKITIDGYEFNIEDVYISQKLKFELGEYVFKFKSPSFKNMEGQLDLLLKSCCTSVKKNNIPVDIPDFMEMPAFVKNWADSIINTVSIKGPHGPIVGLYSILELFSEHGIAESI